MKRKVTLIICSFLSMNFLFAQEIDSKNSGAQAPVTTPLRTVKHSTFKVGEKLTYRLHYGFIDAGLATLEVKESNKKVQGRNLLHIVGQGTSIGSFDWFFKVRDRYDTYIDEQGVFPWLFIRRCDEGGYHVNQDYIFQQHKGKVKTQKGKTHEVPANVQDMLSAFYYARTLDLSNAQEGDVFSIETFLDDEMYTLQIKYAGKETIKIRNGKFRCLKFYPVVQSGRIFKDEEDLEVWITDDANKIPVLAKASILVGSIKMELTNFEGLANPVSKIN